MCPPWSSTNFGDRAVAAASGEAGSGFWRGQRPSLAPYVTVTGPKEGAIASGGHGPQGNPIQFPDSHSIPTSIPSEFPRIDISGRALPRHLRTPTSSARRGPPGAVLDTARAGRAPSRSSGSGLPSSASPLGKETGNGREGPLCRLLSEPPTSAT